MKKILFLMALAAVVMLASSCQKGDDNGGIKSADTKLKVRIANVGAKGRAVEAPATTSQITLNDGIIFIMNTSGAVIYKEAINTTSITSTGQTLAKQISETDKVYIVGNLTTELTTKLMAATNLTLSGINTELSSITSTVGQDYTKVTLANSDSQAAAITMPSGSSSTEATVSVNIAPVYARIELAKVTGASNTNNELTSYNVTGVYVTDYYLQYSLGGSFGGTIYDQKQSTDFSTVDATMKDEATWSSSGTSPNIDAVAAAGKSWVYNVPAGALPRLIIRLDNVVGTMSNTAVAAGNHYLTLTGYSKTGAAITQMERGKIYRLEKLAFNLGHIASVPNEDLVTLKVNVVVVDWVIEVVDGEL